MSSATRSGQEYGVLAEFETASEIFQACEQVRDAGYQRWDSHTPFPVHNLDKAMGLPPSKLPWIVLVMGLTGAASGLLLQWWVSAVDYPVVISGKPYFSWPAFVPIIFELMVLFSAFGAVLGMLGMNKLPQLYHPLFTSQRFERFSDDRFFIAIESVDPKYNRDKTSEFLRTLGAKNVEVVEA